MSPTGKVCIAYQLHVRPRCQSGNMPSQRIDSNSTCFDKASAQLVSNNTVLRQPHHEILYEHALGHTLLPHATQVSQY